MQMPRAMRSVNRVVTNRLMRPLAGWLPPLAVAHHVGRKSGRRYQTPVLAFPTHAGFVTPLPYGVDTDWCLNWIAAGEGTMERGGHRTAVDNPRVLSAGEGLQLLPALVRPALELLGLPGFLVVERRKPSHARSHRRQRVSRRRT
jgi:deazaflavin-dependent oxidoreductase (nitroreductase family)